MPWGKGGRGGRGPGLDRYPGSRRSPSYDEAPRGGQMHRSPAWQGPPGVLLAAEVSHVEGLNFLRLMELLQVISVGDFGLRNRVSKDSDSS